MSRLACSLLTRSSRKPLIISSATWVEMSWNRTKTTAMTMQPKLTWRNQKAKGRSRHKLNWIKHVSLCSLAIRVPYCSCRGDGMDDFTIASSNGRVNFDSKFAGYYTARPNVAVHSFILPSIMKVPAATLLLVAVLPALVLAHRNIDARHQARQASAVSSSTSSSKSGTVATPTSSSVSVSTPLTPGVVTATVSNSSTSLLSGAVGPSVSLLSTNPTALPLSSIVAGAPSQVTHPLTSTPVAGTQPTVIPGAPPLPDCAYCLVWLLSPKLMTLILVTLINPANYPALDKRPPLDSPQVLQWIQDVKNTGVNIPNISPNLPGGCPANLAAVANDTGRCWWTCSGCTRPSDITTCPEKMTWGLTYDDGPSPYTSDLLAFLNQAKLKSTFFSIGSRALSFPAILQSQYLDAHQIAGVYYLLFLVPSCLTLMAVHTWSHPSLTTLTNEEIIAELGWGKKVIKDILGVTPNMMRCGINPLSFSQR
jgi:hypothetical protein